MNINKNIVRVYLNILQNFVKELLNNLNSASREQLKNVIEDLTTEQLKNSIENLIEKDIKNIINNLNNLNDTITLLTDDEDIENDIKTLFKYFILRARPREVRAACPGRINGL